MRNWTAALLLAIIWPLRFWNTDIRKQRWLNRQPERFQNLNFDSVKVNWRKIGLKWGFFMFLALSALMPLFVEDIEYYMVLNIRFILLMTAFTAPVCALMGLL